MSPRVVQYEFEVTRESCLRDRDIMDAVCISGLRIVQLLLNLFGAEFYLANVLYLNYVYIRGNCYVFNFTCEKTRCIGLTRDGNLSVF